MSREGHDFVGLSTIRLPVPAKREMWVPRRHPRGTVSAGLLERRLGKAGFFESAEDPTAKTGVKAANRDGRTHRMSSVEAGAQEPPRHVRAEVYVLMVV